MDPEIMVIQNHILMLLRHAFKIEPNVSFQMKRAQFTVNCLTHPKKLTQNQVSLKTCRDKEPFIS